MNAMDIAYAVEMATKSPLLHNFNNILGGGMHCPRCLLRGDTVRWFPYRLEEWQVFKCVVCDYEVKDR